MITWNLFITMPLFTCSKYTDYTYSLIAIIVASLAVLYPLIGWLADTRFGKFKILHASSFLLLVAIILKSVGIFIIPKSYVLFSSIIVWSLATACDLSSIIPCHWSGRRRFSWRAKFHCSMAAVEWYNKIHCCYSHMFFHWNPAWICPTLPLADFILCCYCLVRILPLCTDDTASDISPH